MTSFIPKADSRSALFGHLDEVRTQFDKTDSVCLEVNPHPWFVSSPHRRERGIDAAPKDARSRLSTFHSIRGMPAARPGFLKQQSAKHVN